MIAYSCGRHNDALGIHEDELATQKNNADGTFFVSFLCWKQGYSSEQLQFDQVASMLTPKGKTTTTDLEKSGL